MALRPMQGSFVAALSEVPRSLSARCAAVTVPAGPDCTLSTESREATTRGGSNDRNISPCLDDAVVAIPVGSVGPQASANFQHGLPERAARLRQGPREARGRGLRRWHGHPGSDKRRDPGGR